MTNLTKDLNDLPAELVGTREEMEATPDYMELQTRVEELEDALDICLTWAEQIAGSDFEASDTLQHCLFVLTEGEEGRRFE